MCLLSGKFFLAPKLPNPALPSLPHHSWLLCTMDPLLDHVALSQTLALLIWVWEGVQIPVCRSVPCQRACRSVPCQREPVDLNCRISPWCIMLADEIWSVCVTMCSICITMCAQCSMTSIIRTMMCSIWSTMLAISIMMVDGLSRPSRSPVWGILTMIFHWPIVTVHAVQSVHAPQSRWWMKIPGTIVVFKACEVALAGSECSRSGQAALAEHLVTLAGFF